MKESSNIPFVSNLTPNYANWIRKHFDFNVLQIEVPELTPESAIVMMNRFWKEEESNTFKCGKWIVQIKKTNYVFDFPFSLRAFYLDFPQTFARSVASVESAVLLALNDFNENVNVPKKFKDVSQFTNRHLLAIK